jgi:hypothetical protein
MKIPKIVSQVSDDFSFFTITKMTRERERDEKSLLG